MRLLLSLVCLVFGMSICTCTHLGTEDDSDGEFAVDYEENTVEGEADEGDDDDDDDDDDDQKNEDVMATSFAPPSNNLASSLRVNRSPILFSGDTVTIQMVFNRWLHVGCSHGRCGGYSCPGIHFEPHDYGRCGGEVFQIYRAHGPGLVRTGDDVGFYFPARRQWIRGWPQTDLAPCPGVPRNSRHRLNTRCWGEVFKLYARGKGIGQPISLYDHVMIYYPRSRAFLQYRHNNARPYGLVRSRCPSLPPRPRSFEQCLRYVFAINKKRF